MSKRRETRLDPSDGNAYNLDEFIGCYGGSMLVPPQEWIDAKAPPVENWVQQWDEDAQGYYCEPSFRPLAIPLLRPLLEGAFRMICCVCPRWCLWCGCADFNEDTNETMWEVPPGFVPPVAEEPAAGGESEWIECWDDASQSYYCTSPRAP